MITYRLFAIEILLIKTDLYIYNIYALTNTYIDRFTSNQTGTCCNISNGGMVFTTLLSFRSVIHHALAKSKKKIVVFFIRIDKSGHRVTCTWLIKKTVSLKRKKTKNTIRKKVDYHSILRTFIISIAFSILV